MLNIPEIRKEWFIEQIESLKKRGIPYAEIAASLGIKPQYINLIRNTERGASEKLTLKLCETFNINHNDLYERIRSYEKENPKFPEGNAPHTEISPSKEIPLHGNVSNSSEYKEKESNTKPFRRQDNEGIDTGNLFPEATSAIRHYGDSMPEYPSGSIVILKRVVDSSLILWGRNYYVETTDFGVIKRLQDGGEDYIVGYSSNLKTCPDGRLIHEPFKIPRKSIRHLYLVLGCITEEFGKGAIV